MREGARLHVEQQVVRLIQQGSRAESVRVESAMLNETTFKHRADHMARSKSMKEHRSRMFYNVSVLVLALSHFPTKKELNASYLAGEKT